MLLDFCLFVSLLLIFFLVGVSKHIHPREREQSAQDAETRELEPEPVTFDPSPALHDFYVWPCYLT